MDKREYHKTFVRFLYRLRPFALCVVTITIAHKSSYFLRITANDSNN